MVLITGPLGHNDFLSAIELFPQQEGVQTLEKVGVCRRRSAKYGGWRQTHVA